MLQDSHPRSSRGVSGDDPEGGAGSGVLRQAARNRSPREARKVARQALRPGCEELAARIRRQLPAVVGRRAPKETEARPRGPKSPRWSAERRASRVMGRKAPRKRLACRVISAFTRVFDARWHAPRVPLHPNVSRRSAHPSIRVGEAKVANPGRRHAPRERDGLFDIVSWKLPKTVRRGAAGSAVLILRSAHAEGAPRNSKGRVRASRRMRTGD